MDEVHIVAESIVNVEVKQEPECLVKTESLELEVPICAKEEVEAQDDEERELEPPAAVPLCSSKEVTREETAGKSEVRRRGLPVDLPSLFGAGSAALRRAEGGRLVLDAAPGLQHLRLRYRAPRATPIRIGPSTTPPQVVGENVLLASTMKIQVPNGVQPSCRPDPQEHCSEFSFLAQKRKKTVLVRKRKRHECSVCQQSFTIKKILDAHMQIHAGEVVGKNVFLASTTKNQVPNAVHPSCQPDPQELCSNIGFLAQKRKKRIIENHECCVCQKEFSCKEILASHMRIHYGKLNCTWLIGGHNSSLAATCCSNRNEVYCGKCWSKLRQRMFTLARKIRQVKLQEIAAAALWHLPWLLHWQFYMRKRLVEQFLSC